MKGPVMGHTARVTFLLIYCCPFVAFISHEPSVWEWGVQVFRNLHAASVHLTVMLNDGQGPFWVFVLGKVEFKGYLADVRVMRWDDRVGDLFVVEDETGLVGLWRPP